MASIGMPMNASMPKLPPVIARPMSASVMPGKTGGRCPRLAASGPA